MAFTPKEFSEMSLEDLFKIFLKIPPACGRCRGDEESYENLCEDHFYERIGEIVDEYPIGIPRPRYGSHTLD